MGKGRNRRQQEGLHKAVEGLAGLLIVLEQHQRGGYFVFSSSFGLGSAALALTEWPGAESA